MIVMAIGGRAESAETIPYGVMGTKFHIITGDMVTGNVAGTTFAADLRLLRQTVALHDAFMLTDLVVPFTVVLRCHAGDGRGDVHPAGGHHQRQQEASPGLLRAAL